MYITHRMEQFSRAYVHAIASVAGYSATPPVVDDDSIDVVFAAKGGHETPRRPRIEAQVKATYRTHTYTQTSINFPLKKKNYDDLRPAQEELTLPRILIVLAMPKGAENWLEHSDESLSLKHCAYWVSLRGQPACPNTSSVTVTVPLQQKLTPEELRRLMRGVGEGTWP